MNRDELLKTARIIARDLEKAKNMKTADDIGEVMSLITKLHHRIKELELENAGLKRGLEQCKSVFPAPIKNIAELHLVEEGNPNYGFSFLDVNIFDIINQNIFCRSDTPTPPQYLVARARYKYLKDARWQVGDEVNIMKFPTDDENPNAPA